MACAGLQDDQQPHRCRRALRHVRMLLAACPGCEFHVQVPLLLLLLCVQVFTTELQGHQALGAKNGLGHWLEQCHLSAAAAQRRPVRGGWCSRPRCYAVLIIAGATAAAQTTMAAVPQALALSRWRPQTRMSVVTPAAITAW